MPVFTVVEPEKQPLIREITARWQDSRQDVRATTARQHGVSLHHVNVKIGDVGRDDLTWEDVQHRLVDAMAHEGKATSTIARARNALAQSLDFAGVQPNPARDPRVRLPREERAEIEPPSAEHVEACAWLLNERDLLGLLVLDATGARVGEIEKATLGDLDESKKSWLVRAAVSKTKKARWIELPDDLYEAVAARLPAREDRDPGAALFQIGSGDRLRMSFRRACRDAGIPVFSPHDLRHRRISLMHKAGESWAEIGARVGQRNISVTADIYTHALGEYREIDRANLLERVTGADTVLTPVPTSGDGNPVFAG